MIDIRRRSFLFGAAATLVVPAPKTFYLPPKRVLKLDEIVITGLHGYNVGDTLTFPAWVPSDLQGIYEITEVMDSSATVVRVL